MSEESTATPAADGRCEECGFDYAGPEDVEVPGALRTFARRYRAPLTRGLPGESLDEIVRARPWPGVWSALEYTCHVRDVFEVQRHRIEQMLAEDVPALGPMNREARVTADRYNEQDPEVVADELAANVEALAAVLEALEGDQWERRGLYSYPEPAEREVRWLARHTVHEGQHHLLDVGRVLRAARGR